LDQFRGSPSIRRAKRLDPACGERPAGGRNLTLTLFLHKPLGLLIADIAVPGGRTGGVDEGQGG
jgi:hypothetical protein